MGIFELIMKNENGIQLIKHNKRHQGADVHPLCSVMSPSAALGEEKVLSLL